MIRMRRQDTVRSATVIFVSRDKNSLMGVRATKLACGIGSDCWCNVSFRKSKKKRKEKKEGRARKALNYTAS